MSDEKKDTIHELQSMAGYYRDMDIGYGEALNKWEAMTVFDLDDVAELEQVRSEYNNSAHELLSRIFQIVRQAEPGAEIMLRDIFGEQNT